VAAVAQSKLSGLIAAAERQNPGLKSLYRMEGNIAEYARRVSAIATAKAKGPEGTMIRLVATMRLVDAALGHGPVPPNRVLSPAELAEAAALLF
jgi:hypothetical protein